MDGEKIKLLTGNQAVAEAQRQIKPHFFLSTYGQRPGSVTASLHQYANNHLFEGRLLSFSSFTELLSFACGAALPGLKVTLSVTHKELTSSLALLHLTALLRLPLVMNVINGPLLPLASAFGNQEAALSVRESGWLQIYTSSAQETYEANLLACKLAADEEVRLPIMIIRDEYLGSEFYEEVSLLKDNYAERFLGKIPGGEKTRLKEIGYAFWRRSLAQASERSLVKYREHARALGTFTGNVLAPVGYYGSPQAGVVLITMGSKSGQARSLVEKLAKDKSLGVLVIRLFRPFPFREIRELLSKCFKVAVWESLEELGGETPLFDDLWKLTAAMETRPPLKVFAGENPRDFFEKL